MFLKYLDGTDDMSYGGKSCKLFISESSESGPEEYQSTNSLSSNHHFIVDESMNAELASEGILYHFEYSQTASGIYGTLTQGSTSTLSLTVRNLHHHNNYYRKRDFCPVHHLITSK